jgi:hypothetical protein
MKLAAVVVVTEAPAKSADNAIRFYLSTLFFSVVLNNLTPIPLPLLLCHIHEWID